MVSDDSEVSSKQVDFEMANGLNHGKSLQLRGRVVALSNTQLSGVEGNGHVNRVTRNT